MTFRHFGDQEKFAGTTMAQVVVRKRHATAITKIAMHNTMTPFEKTINLHRQFSGQADKSRRNIVKKTNDESGENDEHVALGTNRFENPQCVKSAIAFG